MPQAQPELKKVSKPKSSDHQSSRRVSKNIDGIVAKAQTLTTIAVP